MHNISQITSVESGNRHLVVRVDKLSELVGQDASAVLEWKLSTGQDHLYVLLKVTGCSLEEANHQLLGSKKNIHMITSLKHRFILLHLFKLPVCSPVTVQSFSKH